MRKQINQYGMSQKESLTGKNAMLRCCHFQPYAVFLILTLIISIVADNIIT